MSDEDVVRGEEKRLREAAHRKLKESIQRQWERDGYHPHRHLLMVAGDGDGTVLNDFLRREVLTGGRVSCLASYLAVMDIQDVGRATKVSHRPEAA